MADKIPDTIAELEWLWNESDCKTERGRVEVPGLRCKDKKLEIQLPIQSKMNPEYRRKGDLIIAFYSDTEEYRIVGNALKLPNGEPWETGMQVQVYLTKDYKEHKAGTKVKAVLFPNNQVFLFSSQGKVIMGNALWKADFEFV